jgi:outer membrane protein OmpA-like peptidoglycan-associated protein
MAPLRASDPMASLVEDTNSGVAPTTGRSNRFKLMVGGAIAAVVVVIGLIAVLASGGDEPKSEMGETGKVGEMAAAPTPETAQAEAPRAAVDEFNPGDGADEPLEAEAEEEAEAIAADDQAEGETDFEPAAALGAGALATPTSLPLTFGQGKAAYRTGDRATLNRQVAALKRALQRTPEAKLEIGGHTSREGSQTFNRKLGFRRAVMVKKLFVRRRFPANRLVLKSYGEKMPLATGETAAAAQTARRVTVRVVGP